MSSKFKPNTTQTPNVIFDRLMCELPDDEFKVLCAIVRKTYGWHKDSDRISNSQFEAMTGKAKRQIQRAKANLKRKGLIVETPPAKLGGVPEFEFLEPDPVSPMTPPHVIEDTPPVSPMTPTKDTIQKTLDKSEGGKMLMLPQSKPVRDGSVKPKGKAIDFTSIEPVLEVLRKTEKHPEKAISKNTMRMIENAFEEYGEQFVCDAVAGRMIQAQKQGKPLYLPSFFDPDNAEWRADCAKIGESQRNAAEGKKTAIQSNSAALTESDYEHIYGLMGQAQ